MTVCKHTSPFSVSLHAVGFHWGKRFRSPYIGDGLIAAWGKFYYPILMCGNVSIHDIEYRGKINAT